MNFLAPREEMALGTTSKLLEENLLMVNKEQHQKAKDDANQDTEKREASGEGDMLKQIQDIVVPKIDRNVVNKIKIEMMFEQMGDDREKETD